MEAVLSGAAMIKAVWPILFLAGGVEHMSGVPYVSFDARWGCRLQDTVFVDSMIAHYIAAHMSCHYPMMVRQIRPAFRKLKGKPYIMGHTTELIAQLLNISRQEMDEVALRSHNNVERATKNGDFKDEIVPIEIPRKKANRPSSLTRTNISVQD